MESTSCYNPAMKKNRLFIVIALLCVMAATVVRAEEAPGLWSALVPVPDQSETARQEGLQQALAQVLVKQTGSREILNNPAIKQALSLTRHYLTQYGYTRIPAVDTDDEDTLALTASFSENAISRLLQREQLPIWPANRMGMLIWLLRDDPEFGRQHITPELMPEAYQALALALTRRGVPVIKPSLDLQDRLALNPEQAWRFDEAAYAGAAQRYSTSLWLGVRLYQSGDGSWRGSAWASVEGRMFLENASANDARVLINELVDRIVDNYSRNYTYVPQLQAEGLRLTIENVGSYKAYRQVTGYLQNLEVVESLRLERVRDDQLALYLTLNGDASLLRETLQRDTRFEALAPSQSVPGLVNERFRWVGR